MIYRRIIRPLLFLLPPETVHDLVVFSMRIAMKLPGIKYLLKKFFSVKDKKLERKLFGINFSNPVGLAAGFDKNATSCNFLDAFGFSFIEIGTVTPEPQQGNPKPRSFRLTSDNALINRMGFNNKGVRHAMENLKKRSPGIIIGGNIGKNTITPNEDAVKDYLECFETLYDVVDYFAVNVSCPNIGDKGKLQDKETLEQILSTLKKNVPPGRENKPVLLKISPDLNNEELSDVVEVAEKTGVEGIIATNTTITRKNLRTPQSRLEKIGDGGLSGEPLRKRSTEVIKYISKISGKKIPVIGVGGIMTPGDAIEKLEAGASLVQVYTGFIYNGPGFVKALNKSLLKYIDKGEL